MDAHDTLVEILYYLINNKGIREFRCNWNKLCDFFYENKRDEWAFDSDGIEPYCPELDLAWGTLRTSGIVYSYDNDPERHLVSDVVIVLHQRSDRSVGQSSSEIEKIALAFIQRFAYR